jgi:hypothetical protein
VDKNTFLILKSKGTNSIFTPLKITRNQTAATGSDAKENENPGRT